MAELVRQYLGNYRLSYLLGQGGFAEVYLGEHITLKTPVAIKVLRMQLVREAQESFLHEARTIAGLDHPNIVSVFEFGVDHYTPYLVMSYAPKGTLRRRFPRGTILSSTRVLPYIRQTAAALQYAHDRKLVHRDIKPENLLLGTGDHVLLSDFGLAIVSQSTNHVDFQDTAGTMAYMAPEQLQGKACPASDQYALGIVVYEWLTGGWPFNGSQQEIALQHVQRSAPPLAEKVPAIPPAIEQVVMKALAKNPSERFPTVQDFASAFEEACIVELDTQVISTPVQISPAVAEASDMWQIDTPDAPIFMPETGLVPEPFPLFLPDPVSTSAYFHDRPTIITNLSLVSAVPAASGDPTSSLPSPVTSVSIDEASPAVPDVPLPFPAHSLPITPLPGVVQREKTQKGLTRRAVLVGLAGIVATSITGIGISTLASAPKRQTSSHSSQQKTVHSSSPANAPGTANTRKPPARGVTSTTSPGSTLVPEATVPATPTNQPGSKNKQLLTVQITNPLAQVQGNTQVNVDVSTNEPRVTVILHVVYNTPSLKDVTVRKITGSNGHAIFPWQVQVPNKLSSNTTATLTVSAINQNGQKAKGAPLTVSINT
jgi:serine/threonine protein kinase